MPGTRHAKNNTALGFFTRHEKDKLGWGSKRQRLTKDSIKKFDACGICMKVCESPMICPNGDLFCKQCIYQSLLVQKQRNKQKFKEFQMQEFNANAEKERAKQKIMIDNFLKLDSIQLQTKSSPISTMGTENIHTRNMMNKTPFHTTPNSNIIGMEEKSETFSKNINSKILNKSNINDKKLSCFWIPQLAPNVEHSLAMPDMNTYCPGCNKTLKLKYLKSCEFTLCVNDQSIKQCVSNCNGSKMKYDQKFMCGSCQRTLTNSIRSVCLSKCGHIICVICFQKFVIESKACVVCDEPCRKKKHVIILASGGTGFAGNGNILQATCKNVAFQ